MLIPIIFNINILIIQLSKKFKKLLIITIYFFLFFIKIFILHIKLENAGENNIKKEIHFILSLSEIVEDYFDQP